MTVTGRAEGRGCITWDQSAGKWQSVAAASWREAGFPQGDDHLAVCLDLADAHGGIDDDPTRFVKCRDGFVYTSPVGSFPPNPFGLSDVIGNVWEWVQDCYTETYQGAPVDGSAWSWPDCTRRVVRSGSWYGRVWFQRPAARSREEPAFRAATLGLRVVRELP